MCSYVELEDKSCIFFWYKEPDKLLKQQLKQILFLPLDLNGLHHIDLVVGRIKAKENFR